MCTCVHTCVCKCMHTCVRVCGCASGCAHRLCSYHPGRGQHCLGGLWHLLLPVPCGFLFAQQLLLKRAKPSPESVQAFHLLQSKSHSREEGSEALHHVATLAHPLQPHGPPCCFQNMRASLTSGPLHSLFSWPGTFFLHMSRGSRLLFAQASAHVFTEAFLGATPFKWPALPRYHGASHHLPSLCLTSMSPPLCTVSSMSGDTESPAPGAGRGTRLEMSHSRILFQRRFGRCKTQRRQEWASEQAGTGWG